MVVILNTKNIEYRGNNCFTPTKGYCFDKGIIFRAVEDYKQQNLHFLRNEKGR